MTCGQFIQFLVNTNKINCCSIFRISALKNRSMYNRQQIYLSTWYNSCKKNILNKVLWNKYLSFYNMYALYCLNQAWDVKYWQWSHRKITSIIASARIVLLPTIKDEVDSLFIFYEFECNAWELYLCLQWASIKLKCLCPSTEFLNII